MYKPCLYLYNKIDTVTIEEVRNFSFANVYGNYGPYLGILSTLHVLSPSQVDQLARLPHAVVGSVKSNFNIGEPLEDDLLKAKLWEYLGLTRIYTKRKGIFLPFFPLGLL